MQKTRILGALCLMGLLSLGAMAYERHVGAERIRGQVTGYGNIPNDGLVYLSLVLPTLTDEQILSFDFSELLSPNEPMRTGPQNTDVPGNVFAPRQSRRYGWFPITIEKSQFSVYLQPDEENELFTLGVKAPFQELVDAARSRRPNHELMQLIQFDRLGFDEARDWSRVRQPIQTTLRQSRPHSTRLDWRRSNLGQRQSDIVLNLEGSPMGRWLISDLHTRPAQRLTLHSTDFDSKAKAIVGRMSFDERDNFQKLISWFVTHERPSAIVRENLPQELSQIRWSRSERRVEWDASSKTGWVAVLVEEASQQVDNPERKEKHNPEDSFFPDLSDIYDKIKVTTSSEWVRVEEGQLVVEQTPAARADVVLVFLGGDMHEPNLIEADELQLYQLQ